MPVNVANKNLGRAIRPPMRSAHFQAERLEMIDPRLKLFHAQGEVISTVARIHRINSLPDDVQFLILAEAEPSAGKVEGRSRDALQPQQRGIKLAALLDVPHVDGHMIQFKDSHASSTEPVFSDPITALACLDYKAFR
jgi:hypothetical protein